MKKTIPLIAMMLLLNACNSNDDSSGNNYIPPVVNPDTGLDPDIGPDVGPDIGTGPNGDAEPQLVIGRIQSVDPVNSRITVGDNSYQVSRVHYQGQDVDLGGLTNDMNVLIDNSENQGEVTLEPAMTGVIQNINYSAKSFEMNGVTLTYTKIDHSYINGDQYMVFGDPKPDGTFDIYAMHKISNSLGYDQEIEGRVASLDQNQKIARLQNGIAIHYENAVFQDNFQISQNDWIEAHGVYQFGNFIANLIEGESKFIPNQFIGVYERDGIVTWVSPDFTSFEVSYMGRYQITSNTIFLLGRKENLKPGTLVEAKVSFDGSGNGKAILIEFEYGIDFDDIYESMYEFKCMGLATSFQNDVITMPCYGKTVQIKTGLFTEMDYIFRVNPQLMTRIPIEVEGYRHQGRLIAREVESMFD